MLLYKRKIKKLIEKLTGLLADRDRPSVKDNLDFLSAVKAEVESLIKSVDKFTLSLCRDPSLTTKKLRASAIGSAKGSGGTKLKTECSEPSQHFRNDTFNSKFKRHVQNIEKYVSSESAQKGASR